MEKHVGYVQYVTRKHHEADKASILYTIFVNVYHRRKLPATATLILNNALTATHVVITRVLASLILD